MSTHIAGAIAGAIAASICTITLAPGLTAQDLVPQSRGQVDRDQ
jgi:hypothetical protein